MKQQKAHKKDNNYEAEFQTRKKIDSACNGTTITADSDTSPYLTTNFSYD